MGGGDWEAYLDDLESLAAAATADGTIPSPERPVTPLPAELAHRARAALATLAAAEQGLERRLEAVRGEMRSSAQGRRRLAAPSTPRTSTFDIVA